MASCRILLHVALILLPVASGMIHHWRILEDSRRMIALSEFGYLEGGWIDVRLSNITFHPVNMKFAAPLEKMNVSTGDVLITRYGTRLAYLNVCTSKTNGACQRPRFKRGAGDDTSDFSEGAPSVDESKPPSVLPSTELAAATKTTPSPSSIMTSTLSSTSTALGIKTTSKPTTQSTSTKNIRKGKSNIPQTPFDEQPPANKLPNEPSRGEALRPIATVTKHLKMTRAVDGTSWNLQFLVRFDTEQEEGFYVLLFHNCYNYGRNHFQRFTVDANVDIVERNVDTYLQAGDHVKPRFYFAMAAVFMVAALVWLSIVHSKSETEIYRIHHVMSAVVVLKALSLFFHGVNHHYMGEYGHRQEFWAYIYYTVHLLKGAMMFGTIILIGTGYTFFKNYLTERDRKLFMFVLPLQVLDNIALVVVSETDIGARSHAFWMQIFILVDLMCCMAVIFPVIWSIRHLTEASQTDGKAAFNLRKLVLFRQFYLIMITFIYTTRVVKVLIGFSVPFKHVWLVDLVAECGTFVFFVLTGHRFQPTLNNPYLAVDTDDDDALQMEEIVGQSGALSSVNRVRRSGGKKGDLERQLLTSSSESDEHDVVFEDDMVDGRTRPKRLRPAQL